MAVPQYGAGGGVAYPRASQATTVLILGIVGIVLCALAAPFAWQMGNKELAAIDSGQTDPAQRGMANIGRILGIIGTVLMIISIVFLVIFVVLAAASS